MSILFRRIFLMAILCAGFQLNGFAQLTDTISRPFTIDSTAKLIVSSVEIEGNRKTKKYIIVREMRIRKSDTIPAAQL